MSSPPSKLADMEAGLPPASARAVVDSSSRKRTAAARAPTSGGFYGTSVLCDTAQDDDEEPEEDEALVKGNGSGRRRGRTVLGVPRRLACSLVAVVAGLALALLAFAHFHREFRYRSGPAGVAIDVTSRQMALEKLAGQLEPLVEPETRTSANGELNTTLHVSAKLFEAGPISFWTRAYEDSIPGPILRVKPGDVLHLHLVNELGPNVAGEWTMNTMHNPNNTNVHFHGMHVDPTGVEDNVFRVCAPGESMDTTLHVPASHPRGVFHYHPHYHGSVFLQMGGGMVGAVVVEDDPDTVPAAYAAMKQHVVALQEFRFDGGLMSSLLDAAEAARSTLDMQPTYTRGSFLESRVRSLFPREQVVQRPSKAVKMPEDWESSDDDLVPPISMYYAVNGQYLPKIEVRPRENRLLRLINAGGTAELEIVLPGCSMTLAASDGIYLSKPRLVRTLLLSPGGRVDVVINCEPNAEGEKDLEALRPLHSVKNKAINEFLGGSTDVFKGVLAFIHVQGDSLEQPEIAAIPPAPAMYGEDTSLMSLSTEDREQMDPLPFVFEYTMGTPVVKDGFQYKQYFINHKLFDGTSVHTMVLGRVQEWVIVNHHDEQGELTQKNHPFHLHTNAFQVIDMSHGHGLDYEIGDWRDTILVPTPGNVTIRFRPLDYTGVVAAHCHILGHSDAGMIAGVDMVSA